MPRPRYYVRSTDRASGRSMIEAYATARRAKEVVEITHARHAAANTDAEYIGRMS